MAMNRVQFQYGMSMPEFNKAFGTEPQCAKALAQLRWPVNVVGASKPHNLPQFTWVNTVLGNLKTSFAGAYHALDCAKYADAYLAAFCYRFNRRLDLRTLVVKLMADTALCGPHPLLAIRAAEGSF